MNFSTYYFISANDFRTSLCSAAFVTVRDDKIIRAIEYKVSPFPNNFDYYNIDKYKLNPAEYGNTDNSVSIIYEISNLQKDVLFTHFSSFQNSLFYNFCDINEVERFKVNSKCTMNIIKALGIDVNSYGIESICNEYNIDLGTSALSYATAVAEIVLNLASEIGCSNEKDFIKNIPKLQTVDGTHIVGRFTERESIYLELENLLTPNSSIECKYFCFTGEMEYCKRDDAYRIVEKCGGLISKGITSKTDYLVVGNNEFHSKEGKVSSKKRKAIELANQGAKIKVISENRFIEFLNL